MLREICSGIYIYLKCINIYNWLKNKFNIGKCIRVILKYSVWKCSNFYMKSLI